MGARHPSLLTTIPSLAQPVTDHGLEELLAKIGETDDTTHVGGFVYAAELESIGDTDQMMTDDDFEKLLAEIGKQEEP